MPEATNLTGTTLVIGAGELGSAVIDGLLEQNPESAGSISVLLRLPADAIGEQIDRQLQDKGLQIVPGDLATETVDGLAAIFAPFDTVICCTGFVGSPGTQRKITEAVLQAGVERYVPWQFGVDYDVVGHGSGQPVFDEQADVRDMLRGQSATEWVIVSTGMFTSFLFEPAFGLVDLERPRVHALGSWENRLTVTTSDDIGRLTAAILAHQPRIRDEVVYVAGDTFSYAQLADMVEGHLGRDAERVLWDMDRLQSEVASHPGGFRHHRDHDSSMMAISVPTSSRSRFLDDGDQPKRIERSERAVAGSSFWRVRCRRRDCRCARCARY